MSDDERDDVKEADGFEDAEERTSPELVRAGAHRGVDPMVVVCTPDGSRRRALVSLLGENGWNAVEQKTSEELLETSRALNPEVIIVDSGLRLPSGASIPEVLRQRRPDAIRRIMALVSTAQPQEVAGAVVDGYDDFIVDADNPVEVLARTTANLRACRTLQEMERQKRDAATLLELSQTLASSLDLQLILHMVSRLISEVIGLERCSIVILDPEHNDAVMVAASEDRKVKDLRINLLKYPELQRCVQAAAPVLITNAHVDPMLDVARGTAVDSVRMMVLFPIIFEERVTGVLFLRSHQVSRDLSDHEVQFGQTVASACAVAIRNARLFDSFRDQNERINYMRIAAERQMEALKKYEDFFEYAADGMAIIDTNESVLYVNREGRRLLGRQNDGMRGQAFSSFIVEDSRDRWAGVVDLVRHGRFKHEVDLVIARGDGKERVISLSAGGGGQETGLIILSFRDVTETREMEGELRTTKDFLENLVDHSVDAIVASDLSGNIMLFNKGAERITGHKADDVIGHLHVSQLYPPGVANEIMAQLRDERWGGKGRLEVQRKEVVTARGDTIPVSMSASIIYEDGDEVATVGIFQDLRDRLRIEKQLVDAQEELMKTEKARVAAELAGMAAHELNQPLTSVLGYAEMLRHKIPETDAKVRKHIDTIYGQAERMAEIVRKIGRITKYETTNYTAATRMLNLDASVDESDAIARSEAVTLPPIPASEGADTERVRVAPGPARPTLEAKRAAPVDPRSAIVRLDTVDSDEGPLSLGAPKTDPARPVARPPTSAGPPPPDVERAQEPSTGKERYGRAHRSSDEHPEVTSPGRPLPNRADLKTPPRPTRRSDGGS